MQPYQERVIIEKSELDTKIEKLETFLFGDGFPLLQKAEQIRMAQQFGYMRSYSEVLRERIENF